MLINLSSDNEQEQSDPTSAPQDAGQKGKGTKEQTAHRSHPIVGAVLIGRLPRLAGRHRRSAETNRIGKQDSQLVATGDAQC